MLPRSSPVLDGEYPSPVLAGELVPQDGGTPLALGYTPYPRLWFPPVRTGLYPWDWGTPCLGLGHPLPGTGVPHPRKDLGPEICERTWNWGTPLEGTWNQSLGYPWKGHGTSGLKYYEMEMGYRMALTDRHMCENITSRRTP